MKGTAGVLAMRGVDWAPVRLDFFFKRHSLREGFHVLAAEFVGVSIERGLESLIKSEDYNRFRSADHMPEWLREDTKPSRTSIAIVHTHTKKPKYMWRSPYFGLLTGCCSARSAPWSTGGSFCDATRRVLSISAVFFVCGLVITQRHRLLSGLFLAFA
jgi:hypothetical protein